jgi:hypothetical protein
LRCPHCEKRLERSRRPIDRLFVAPHVGELTQCDHCGRMLAYTTAKVGLALESAPQKRVQEFYMRAAERGRELTLAELVSSTMKCRRTPKLVRPVCFQP